MTIASKLTFPAAFKHGRFTFLPGPTYGFEHPDAGEYFTAAAGAETSEADPDLVVAIGEIEIDPGTIWGNGPNKGEAVLAEG